MLKWVGLAAVGAAVTVTVFAVSQDRAGAQPAPTVTVYKSPTCGCCTKWVEHLETNGFDVQVHDVNDLTQIKSMNGVTAQLSSCHTAVVEGYVVEGHVPASDIRRLLEERPAVAGLAVPGMPIGSPGMEGPNPQAYNVLTFDRDGGISVWSSR